MRMSRQPSRTQATPDVANPNHSLRGVTSEPTHRSVDMVIPLQVRDAVKESHDEEPDDIDKVPISRRHLIGLVRASPRHAVAGNKAHKDKQQQANDDVRSMQSSDGVENRSVGIAVRREVLPFRGVLKSLQ